MMFEEVFGGKRIDIGRLPDIGFVQKDGQYFYTTDIMGGAFRLKICFDESGKVDTELFDQESGEPYVLYKTDAAGAFVGEVREAVERVLSDIAASCFLGSAFSSRQTEMLLAYATERYGSAPEFLWDKYPDCAVLRCKDNAKWYGIVMTIPKRKLGIPSDEIAEILDLRFPPEQMADLLEKENFYPGWHMNKKHWYTVVLDGSIGDDDLCELVDISYRLAQKSK